MTSYDPFARGPHPVGVRSHTWTDESRGRALPVEVWYPATDAHCGEDLDPERQDRFRAMPMAPETQQAAARDAEPRGERVALVVFSHGFGGDRRQTTHFCTHLASHGYAVASMDHVGNTTADMIQQAMAAASGAVAPDPFEMIGSFIADRPADASFVIDQMLAGAGGVPIDAGRIGITGHSFGGWTTLQTTGRDARIRAALPLAPAGGASPLTGALDREEPIGAALDLAWDREVPTLFLVADRDTLLPLPGMRRLIQRTRGPRRAIVLREADHFHFCDGVERMHDLFRMMGPMMSSGGPMAALDTKKMFEEMKPAAELCPGEHAYAMIQGLGLAHMDTHLREHEGAATWIGGDLVSHLAERGIRAEELE
jgi:dienelactone hydrolase